MRYEIYYLKNGREICESFKIKRDCIYRLKEIILNDKDNEIDSVIYGPVSYYQEKRLKRVER